MVDLMMKSLFINQLLYSGRSRMSFYYWEKNKTNSPGIEFAKRRFLKGKPFVGLVNNMFTYRICVVFISLLAIISCQQVDPATAPEVVQKLEPKQTPTDEADKPSTQKERIKSKELPDCMKVDIQGTDPEKYAVQFSWPYLQDEKILRVRLGSVLGEVLSSQTFFTHILPHNQAVTFSFDVLDKNRKPEFSFTKTIQIPADLVVRSDTFDIKKNQRIEVNRLFLSNEFPLTINDHTVDIVTNEIHAERGFIQTFPEKIKVRNANTGVENEMPPTAMPLNEGRSGGYLSITSKKLFGRLKIFMRGENGGEGSKGDPITNQKSGEGAPAGEGELVCHQEIDDCVRHPMHCMPSPAQVNFLTGNCFCQRLGVKGGLGITGDKGNKGKQGMKGGDSGGVRVSIEEYISVEGVDTSLLQNGDEVVQIQQIPGIGGGGGPGGDGQRGSLGGRGRNPARQDDCRGEAGDEGPRGTTGEIGLAGVAGNVGLKCIIIASKNISQCTQ